MFLLIDTANLAQIRFALEYFPLAGVTTCPTIITKERRPFWEHIMEIRRAIGTERMLHAQVMGRTADEMFRDAVMLKERICGEFYVKIPASQEGFKAMMAVQREGIPFTATTIHSLSQAMIAADCGASFLAPYINHIEDDNHPAAEFVSRLAAYLEDRHLPAKILAASFRNTRQITDVLCAGAHTVTIAPELLKVLYAHPMTDAAVAKFRSAWDDLYGADKALYNL